MVWLAVVLLIAWLLGFVVFHVAGGLIHLLLVIAVVVFLFNFISGRRTVWRAHRRSADDEGGRRLIQASAPFVWLESAAL
jgi:membrane protein DedA with SNARE-associated domain